MTQSGKGCSLQLGLANFLAIAGVSALSIASFFANSAFAQSVIIPDRTLGSEENSQKIENYGNNPIEVLTGGAIRGQNLFHSFLEFNVSEGRSAFFLNPSSDIQNIFVRVTGSNHSKILGTLGTFGFNANLLMINPHGIVFGANARLNVSGSFVASTANGIKFADGNIFSATSPQTIPLLTVNVPLGLQFAGTGGEIKMNRQSFLQVPSGKTLALVGGNVSLDGGYQLFAPSGQIALGGILEAGTIGLNFDTNDLPLSFPNDVALADITLNNQATVDVSGEGGGSIQIQGQRVTLTNGARAIANTEGSQNGKVISIQAQQLTLQEGSQITTTTFGTGSGGSLEVKADSVQVSGTDADDNPSALFADTYSQGAGGHLTVETGQLIVDKGGNISTSSRLVNSQGSGGTLNVTAANFVKLSGISEISGNPSGLFTQTEGEGNAGSLTIKASSLLVEDGAVVAAGTYEGSRGNGGTLTVHTSDFIELRGTAPNSSENTSGLFARSLGSGDAGSLWIDTRQLIVRERAQVTVSALEGGNAGNLEITARNINLDTQGKLLAQTTSGKGGDIKLQLQNLLLLRNNSEISTSAGIENRGGDGGNININIPNGFIVAVPDENSNISTEAYTGNGGTVNINAFRIFGIQPRKIDNPITSDITASSERGVSGTINIKTPDIELTPESINLPTKPSEPKLVQVCQARAGRNQSTFTMTGRGGLPPSPTETLNNDAVLADWIPLGIGEIASHVDANINLTLSQPATIVEATGWTINTKGEVVLVANAPTVTLHNSWQKSTDCAVSQSQSNS